MSQADNEPQPSKKRDYTIAAALIGAVAVVIGAIITAYSNSGPTASSTSPTPPPTSSAKAASPTEGSVYSVENQWGGSSAPWRVGGTWVLGARASQPVVALKISSADGGATLTGTMTYKGESPIGFRSTREGANNYVVENQWGGNTAPWHPGGRWIIGYRTGPNVVSVDVTSPDDGATLSGTMTYAGEGPIGFRATRR